MFIQTIQDLRSFLSELEQRKNFYDAEPLLYEFFDQVGRAKQVLDGILPSADFQRILMFLENLRGKTVLIRFGDVSLAMRGMTVCVNTVEIDAEQQLLILCPKDGESWVFQYEQLYLLPDETMVAKNEDAVLRVQILAKEGY